MASEAEESETLSPLPAASDHSLDQNLRPHNLGEYIGQNKIKEKLSIFIEAARHRGEGLDHVLFYGPPGLGKTSLAYIIAAEMGVNVRTTSGPALERAGDLAALLTNLEPHDVLFIDEIHRLSSVVEETLYPAMEDYKLDIIIGEGPSARSIQLDLPRFTLIGATTRAGSLTSPLRDRFGISARLNFYDADELQAIAMRSAKILDITIDEQGAFELAKRSRGTPRIVNRLLRRVRDYSQVRGSGIIDLAAAQQALQMLEVDQRGLDAMDRLLLLTIIEKFQGGPVGIDTLAAAISEEKTTIEDVCEPYLIQSGLIDRTPRGRVATPRAYQHLGLEIPASRKEAQSQLL